MLTSPGPRPASGPTDAHSNRSLRRVVVAACSLAALALAPSCGRDPLDARSIGTAPGSGGATGGGLGQGGQGASPGGDGSVGTSGDAGLGVGGGGRGGNGGGAGVGGGPGGAGGLAGGGGGPGPGGGPGGAAGGPIDMAPPSIDGGPQGLIIRPMNGLLPIKSTVVFTAHQQTGPIFRDVTALATWSVSDTALAMIVANGPQGGRLISLAPGNITVRATYQPMGFPLLAGTTTATITPAQITSIGLLPSAVPLNVGGRGSVQANASYSDGMSRNITEQAVWTSDNAMIASVSNDPNQRGVVQGNAAGTTGVLVSFAGFERRAMVTVGGAPTSLTIGPPTLTTAVGQSVRYQATATLGGMLFNATNQATWALANPAIAMQEFPGSFRCLTSGTTGITATYMGASAKAELVCGDGMTRPIKELRITPEEATIPGNFTITLTLTAIYTDGSSMTLRNVGAWMSSNPMTASVNQTGLLTTLRAGMTTITVTYSGFTAKANITVTGP